MTLLGFAFVLAFIGGGDIQEAVQAAQQTTSVLLPPTVPALPEETAWQMIYAEGGVLALILAVAVYTLWKLFSKILLETRAQNAELVNAQSGAIKQLSEGVAGITTAIKVSDANNTHALARLTENIGDVVVRQDKHEERLGRHSDRISVLEVERKIAERTQPQVRNGTS